MDTEVRMQGNNRPQTTTDTVNYIEHNRAKHQLPHNKTLQNHIGNMVCSPEDALASEYNGGFDVVIGNPPYVSLSEFPSEIHECFKANYASIHTGYNDLMYYFLSKSMELINNKGCFGMITSNYFLGNEYAKALRNILARGLRSLVNFGEYHVFEDANVRANASNFSGF